MIHFGYKTARLLFQHHLYCHVVVRGQDQGRQGLRAEMICVLSPDIWGPCKMLLAATVSIVIIDELQHLLLD